MSDDLIYRGARTTSNALSDLLSTLPESRIEAKYMRNWTGMAPRAYRRCPEQLPYTEWSSRNRADLSTRLAPDPSGQEEFQIGGMTIPRYSNHDGTYVMQRDERYFAEPDRFLRIAGQMTSRKASHAMRISPSRRTRVCIGQGFAMWKRTNSGDNRPTLSPFTCARSKVEMQPLITLRPRNGLHMTIKANVRRSKRSRRMPFIGIEGSPSRAMH